MTQVHINMAVIILGECYLPITIIITIAYQLIVFIIAYTLQVDTAITDNLNYRRIKCSIACHLNFSS
ncbi:13230_t:CDS:2 [Cetraspora pellucida]|uniref:13230_t:CDS:1 n=1 Tax=Cetraspora pellucida TaxID=1433469 RepID=A0A9N8ZEZ9_9GLOM|nr:13230_t:CDS:2 [Cetraspora pellucida]